MRFLFALHNCFTDPTNGAVTSMRTLARWLAEAGHQVRVHATSRFDSSAPFSIHEHLAGLGVAMRELPPDAPGQRPVRRYEWHGLPVEHLMTEHAGPDRGEHDQFVRRLDAAILGFKPDALVAMGTQPIVLNAMKLARGRGVTTIYSVRNHGYEDRQYFADADAVFTSSPWLSERYRRTIGLHSAGLVSPMDWAEVLAPHDSPRAHLTFVNPSWHKGLGLVARLAEMFGRRRPDVPVLIVQSTGASDSLASIDGIDLTRLRNVTISPPVPRPAEIFTRTRLLLAPSVFEEPFGRVAAEAMINGVPAIVSDRGALPATIGADQPRGPGGVALPLPAPMLPGSRAVPSEEQAGPWFEAVIRLWDDPAEYARLSSRAEAFGKTAYNENKSRDAHVAFFTSARPGRALFD